MLTCHMSDGCAILDWIGRCPLEADKQETVVSALKASEPVAKVLHQIGLPIIACIQLAETLDILRKIPPVNCSECGRRNWIGGKSVQ